MKSLSDIASEQQALSISQSDDPQTLQLMRKLLEVAEDACVARDRLRSAQQLALGGTAPTDAAIDRFSPSEDEVSQRLAAHTAYFEAIYRDLAKQA